MIVIIDYGMGNLHSVFKSFKRIGVDVLISSDIKEIENASKIVLPGVGHFASGVANLKTRGLWDLVNKVVLKDKKPILGICLGMQLMSAHSEEGDCKGFGWFDAEVLRFRVSDPIQCKVPHTGWNTLKHVKESPLLRGINEKSEFYFVHSYHFRSNQEREILTTTEYDYTFTSSVAKENIFGVQFHPEKSHDAGLQMLKNFVEI